jgi:hypothetical protein
MSRCIFERRRNKSILLFASSVTPIRANHNSRLQSAKSFILGCTFRLDTYQRSNHWKTLLHLGTFLNVRHNGWKTNWRSGPRRLQPSLLRIRLSRWIRFSEKRTLEAHIFTCALLFSDFSLLIEIGNGASH